ncbi:MAG: phage regulator Rha-like protein [Candidatus Omnitrophota bacterium]|jgi:phage regulator Rha-like protein
MSTSIPEEVILTKVHYVRGIKVMLDRDLAMLYGVTTGNLNKAVKRKSERFPEDFMFQLNQDEIESLRFQSGSLKRGQHRKYLPYVFTQEGIAMLSSVLNSKQAVSVNIAIMRVFVKLRQIMMTHKDLATQYRELRRQVSGHDKSIKAILEAMRLLMEEPKNPKGKIGFYQT